MHRDKLDNINYIVPDLHELFIDVKKLLNISVVSATIESLSDDPSLSSWVYQGLTLHKQKDAASCMFCNQKMLGERMSELEAHFNNEYENMLSRLKEELNRISEIREDLGKIKTPHVKELYEDIQDEYSQYEKMNQEQKLLIDKFLDGLGEKLREKKNRVFEKMPLDILVPEKSHKLFDGINSIIKKHNERSDIFEIDVEKARKSIEADHVAQNLEEYMNRKEDLDEAEKRVEKLDQDKGSIDEEIGELTKQMQDHRPPAEELNRGIHHYLGHDELQLEVSKTGYVVKRGDELAKGTLSEGEETAVALLYFLKSLKDKSFNLPNGIVVFDDPVSSLDSNALYLAVGCIVEETENASQLFILTHNFTLFRQVRNWFEHIGKSSSAYYMLDCYKNEKKRCAYIKNLDPLLKKHDSEYHFLFATVYSAANSQSSIYLEEYYGIVNIARRLLEAFLSFKQPGESGIWNLLQNVDFEKKKKSRMYNFLNTYSHNTIICETEHNASILNETQEVLQDILYLIKQEDEQHYDRMVEISKNTIEKI